MDNLMLIIVPLVVTAIALGAVVRNKLNKEADLKEGSRNWCIGYNAAHKILSTGEGREVMESIIEASSFSVGSSQGILRGVIQAVLDYDSGNLKEPMVIPE